MYGAMEESTPAAEAPALGPAEIKFVRKLMATSTSKTTISRFLSPLQHICNLRPHVLRAG